MKTKAETLSTFKKIVAEAKSDCRPTEVQLGALGGDDVHFLSGTFREYCQRKNIPIVLRTDSDSIFKSAGFCKYCQDNDTDLEYSSPGDQFFNGKVEHLIGILKIKMFTVLKAANLGMEYWPEALALCVYTYNRMPTKANEDCLSPYHMYRGKPPRIGHLRGFGCECTYWGPKSMSKGSGRPGVFLGYTPRSPTGTYRIGVKGNRNGTMVDSRHVIFQENQVLPKFVDKTKMSHISTETNSLLVNKPLTKSDDQSASRGRKSKDVKDSKEPKKVTWQINEDDQSKTKRVFGNPRTVIWQDQKVQVKVVNKKKYNVQSLVDEKRVLIPGRNYHPKNGNRAKYIADRLQCLVGLTPEQSTELKYLNSKGVLKKYRYEDCKYDLNNEYLELADRQSTIGRASVNMAEWLTPKIGGLTEAVTNKMPYIEHQDDANHKAAAKHKGQVKRRDIEGGQTAGDLLLLSGSKSNCKAAQPLLSDQSQGLTRDEKALIVKAEHLGVVTGIDISLTSSNGGEAYYVLVNDEVNSLVYNERSRLGRMRQLGESRRRCAPDNRKSIQASGKGKMVSSY